MARFGKKNDVKIDMFSYNHAMAGISGIGKTTIAKEICEENLGEDGYIHLDMGKEDGADAIQGIVTEKVEDWATAEEIKDDIITNKEEDYPKLRMLIADTVDQWIPLAEEEIIRRWNRIQKQKKDGKIVNTINQAYGGYGRGQDEVIKLILDYVWELKKVGVQVFFIFHTKKRTLTDPVSGESYDIISSLMEQKYFNAFKTKMHFLSVAYIDRSVNVEKTGRKINGKDEEKGSIANERRVIAFRDEGFSVDSKSRFADIVDKIEFSPFEYKDAVETAIRKEASKKKTDKTIEERAAEQKKEAEKKQKVALKEKQEDIKEENDIKDKDKLKNVYKKIVKDMDSEQRAGVKKAIVEHKIDLKNWNDNAVNDIKKFIKNIKDL